ncbi:MAG: fatty acid hydroxylase [Sphingobacteriales bacterium]|nr:MAG: fatty acid hydroxylase [Sphingobacteriales bacterium]TAF78891.1 MAG: fatty acid hydroxylase [Sphingobacteriales bacterium]
MQVLINIGIVLLSIVIMEAFSWTVHKYLFHGPLWFIHKTHHLPQKGFFEYNDIFSIFFALLALFLLWRGHNNFTNSFWVGTGISIYGIIYFVFHDCFIHGRIKPFKSHNAYLWLIKRAHKIHHKSLHKKPSNFFGLLWVNPKNI